MTTIAIDIDETIYPLMVDWINLYYAKTGHVLTIEDFKTYGIHHTMNQIPRKQVYELLDHIEYDSPPYENAIKVITALGQQKSNRIVFHSTVHNMKQAEFKLSWLQRYFRGFNWDVVFGQSGENKLKYISNVDLIIEDSPDNANYILTKSLSCVLLLEKPYNTEIEHNPRVNFANDWYEAQRILTDNWGLEL